MKFTRFGIICLTLLLTLGLWSCGSKKEKEDNNDEFKQAEESLTEEIKDVAIVNGVIVIVRIGSGSRRIVTDYSIV